MAKFPTFPTLYDSCKTVSIAFLNKHGYLKPNQFQSGTITWSQNGNKTGSISIRVNTLPGMPYLELDYKANETPVNYRVHLVSVPSNLGKGVVWFFLCPRSGKRCRKLYLVDTYFYHRSAFRGCMYDIQTQSKKSRNLQKFFGKAFGSEKAYDQIYKKHFKKYYNGKPTKRFLKLMKVIQASESIPLDQLERMMVA